MKRVDLPATPPALTPIPPIPVICDRCRAVGMAGDAVFSAIPDILEFSPVERRVHSNNWTPQHQRAFIAALAITGSPRRAARTIGKHAFGAEQLRSARGGSSFAAAWDAALEIARDCETARIHTSLAGLAEEEAASHALAAAAPGGTLRARHRAASRFDDDDDDIGDRFDQAQLRIRARLTNARRLFLALIADDPEKRAAWETLVDPVDWDLAANLQPQDNEPFNDDPDDLRMPRMGSPDMLIVTENGLLADVAGGEDAMAPLRQIVADELAARRDSPPPPPVPGESDADRKARIEAEMSTSVDQTMRAAGWTTDAQGNWCAPTPEAPSDDG